MIILDTDVLSSLMLAEPDGTVTRWLDQQPRHTVWTTTITVYEVMMGFSLLPHGARRQRLEAVFAHVLSQRLEHRVHSLDQDSAERAGRLGAERKLRGLNVSTADTLIAGIALSLGATIATGNSRHFPDLGTRVINPWDPDQPERP